MIAYSQRNMSILTSGLGSLGAAETLDIGPSSPMVFDVSSFMTGSSTTLLLILGGITLYALFGAPARQRRLELRAERDRYKRTTKQIKSKYGFFSKPATKSISEGKVIRGGRGRFEPRGIRRERFSDESF